MLKPFGFFGAGDAPFSSTYSMEFDGIDDAVRLGPLVTSLGLSTAISVSVWAKMPAGTLTLKSLISEDQSGGATRNWNLIVVFNDLMVQLWNADGTLVQITDPVSSRIQDGNWHHVMFSYDGTTDADGLKLWVDGVNVVSGTAGSTGIRTAAVTTWIGAIGTTGTNWNWGGHIDEVSTWSAVKLPDDVRDSATSKPIDLSGESGLHSWTRMGEDGVWGTLWTLPDESENSYEAISQNMTESDRVEDTP